MPNTSVTARAVRVSSPGAPLKFKRGNFLRARSQRRASRKGAKPAVTGYSESLTKEGQIPGIPYPISPGHEVIGLIEALGDGVTTWSLGQRVGVGWYGGHCGVCDRCRQRRLRPVLQPRSQGLTFDGGYADYSNVFAQSPRRGSRFTRQRRGGPAALRWHHHV